MFSGVEGIATGYILCGVIWALALGFAAGNYACSLVHRLPRGRLILDKKPYCGSCGAALQVKDLFPVVSALLLRHRCRYCKTPYPVSHTWTELLVGALFVLAYLRFNFNEPFLLTVALGVFLITLAAIEANEKMVMGKILICVAVCGMVLRTRMDASIYGFFEGALYGTLLGAALFFRQVKKVGHIYVLPAKAQLLALGGLCAGAAQFIPFVVFFGLFALLGKCFTLVLRRAPLPVTVPFGFAVMLCALYSGLFILP